MTKRRRTDNTMTKRQSTKGETTIYKTPQHKTKELHIIFERHFTYMPIASSVLIRITAFDYTCGIFKL
jgi:hypothetical protein